MIYEVKSKEDFDDQLKDAGERLVVIDFHATWCGPCKRIAPYIVELNDQYKDKIVFLKLNVDEVDELVSKYKVASMPTFVFLRKGDHLDTLVGANEDKLKEIIDKHLD